MNQEKSQHDISEPHSNNYYLLYTFDYYLLRYFAHINLTRYTPEILRLGQS